MVFYLKRTRSSKTVLKRKRKPNNQNYACWGELRSNFMSGADDFLSERYFLLQLLVPTLHYFPSSVYLSRRCSGVVILCLILCLSGHPAIIFNPEASRHLQYQQNWTATVDYLNCYCCWWRWKSPWPWHFVGFVGFHFAYKHEGILGKHNQRIHLLGRLRNHRQCTARRIWTVSLRLFHCHSGPGSK